jgi:pyridoxal 5'-phosphate synthase pdxS subunit
VGSGIFKSADPAKRARAIVAAVTYYRDPEMLAKISMGLLDAMRGIDIHQLGREELLAQRGW